MKKHDKNTHRVPIRQLDELTLYQSGDQFILWFRNGSEQSFDCIDTATREMLYAFFRIIENRKQNFIHQPIMHHA